MAIVLGDVLLDGLEAPAGVTFGGAQALAVHRLPGGARIIDAMGQDDANICWRGVLSGANAMDRARQLDAMRVVGAQIALAWNETYYNVVIAQLHLVYHSAWWIVYGIACTVVTSAAAEIQGLQPAPLAQMLSDLSVASAWTSTAAASAAVGANGATETGTAAYAVAASALAASYAAAQTGILSTSAGLDSSDVLTVAASAGGLAGYSAASGYIGRAMINLANAGA